MTARRLAALRKSIRLGMAQAVAAALFAPPGWSNECWYDPDGDQPEWRGKEVARECERAWRAFLRGTRTQSLGERIRKERGLS